MEQTCVFFDDSSAKISSDGLVTADFRVRIGDFDFPHPQWNDFAVVVLSWWTAACARLLSGQTRAEPMRFMDGPYLLEVSIDSNHSWLMVCVEAGLKRRVRHEGLVDGREFAQFVADLADRALAVCRFHNWYSREVETLEAESRLLRAVLARSANLP